MSNISLKWDVLEKFCWLLQTRKKLKKKKKNKQITRAEDKSKEPDPSRPARDLSSESHHTNKDSQISSQGAVRVHCWKWILRHMQELY